MVRRADRTAESVSCGFSALFEDPQMQKLLNHVTREEIPGPEDLHSAAGLSEHLDALREPPASLVAVGDIMLGARANTVVGERGADYPFEATLPILQWGSIVLGNLEGPLASRSSREVRNYS